MATWSKSKVNASDVNNGNEFNSGDGVRNTDINKIFQSSLYSQDIVQNIGIGTVTSTSSGGNASASISYDSTTGYPKINLVLPRGERGEQGPEGGTGSIATLVYSGNSTGNWQNFTTTSLDFSTDYYLVYVKNDAYAGGFIVKNGNGLRVVTSFGVSNYELTIKELNISISGNNQFRAYGKSTTAVFDPSGASNSDYTENVNLEIYALKLFGA